MATKAVCISVDHSPASQDALSWAANYVLRPGDKVKLVTVMEPSVKSELAQGVDPMRGLTAAKIKCEADPATLAKTQEFLAQCKDRLVKEGVSADAISTEPLVACIGNSHDIGRQIIDAAEKCDSLVMGSRGLSASKRTLLSVFGLGSVSDYVVKHAPCNVIVHKSK